MSTGFPTPAFSDDPPPPSRWWTQLQSLHAPSHELTQEERSAITTPVLYGGLTYLAILAIVFLIDRFSCHVSFSVESISVSPSFDTWHVDFLVKNPFPSMFPVNYDRDNVYAKLGSLNAVVLKTTHNSHSSFSLDFATEGNQSDVVSTSPRVFDLDIKLSAKKKHFMLGDEFGHFGIRCHNITLGHDTIKCHSSFKRLEQCC